MSEKKIGVYVCSGCGIGESLDCAALCKVGDEEYKVSKATTHNALCSEEGLKLINDDISGQTLDTVVIAACSPRVKSDLFTFADNILLERVNIREHVIWCQKPKDEDTLMMAEDYLRMGIVKAQKSARPEPYLLEEVSNAVLVIGGGISGMTSALEAAEIGNDVILIEKEEHLGGMANKLLSQYPKDWPFDRPTPTGIAEVIDQVEKNNKIKVCTSTKIKQVSGAPGLFDISLEMKGDESNVKAGSIILATGWTPPETSKLEHLAYGKHPNIVTNVQMEELISKAHGGELKAPDGSKPQRIAFIQCAGQRDENLPYCSSVCCMVSLKQAIQCREQNQDARVFVLYKDLRTPGHYEEFYKKAQDDEGVFLTKCEIKQVEASDQGIFITAENTLLGENITVQVDMLVLAAGMVPSALDNKIINLTYRKGTDLPDLKYGFTDSHFVCFPYETQRTGIYATGCVRSPMNMAETITDATGAAFKAVQSINLVEKGETNYPRLGDKSYPELYLKRCTQCKRCTEECPFGTYDEDEKGTPKPNPTRCRRCGICMGSCPERIISFKDYNIEIISSMIKAINVPDEFDEKPRILAFICENDSYPAIDLAGINRLQYSPYVRIIPVRCIGSINNVHVADALSAGIDGILMIGCKYGDDYQCHFIKGSELVGAREENLQETLQRLMLERERVTTHQLAITEYKKVSTIFSEYVEQMEEFGPNPFKGM